MAISILLADDHKIFRESLRILLERHEDFQVVGEAANGQIGELHSISARTVETHRAQLMLKLGLKSRLELTRYAQEQQLE